MKNILTLLHAVRLHQWIKNLSLFAPIIFTGHLLEGYYFYRTLEGFFIFCLLSSASYLFNDIRDLPLDKKHPKKKHRPIASGALSLHHAKILIVVFFTISMYWAFTLGIEFFLICLLFAIIHFAYTLALKQHSLLDILAIASSFLIRVFAGEVLTGLHIPIWLTFSVIFLSLFIASCKRRSELVTLGRQTRPALEHYRSQLLDFYISTFATAAIIAYAMFTFQAQSPNFNPLISEFLEFVFPAALGRKWLMVSTLPLIIVGIMRYAQLIYERKLGEAPERLLTSDKFLLITVGLWGFSIILFTYIL